jgi:hypothetical protein
MDKLFDIFNFSKSLGLKSFKGPFESTAEKINHLNKMANIFKNLKVIHMFKKVDETKRMNFIELVNLNI